MSITTKWPRRSCLHFRTTSHPAIGSEPLLSSKISVVLTSKNKIVCGLPIATSTWESIEKPFKYTINYFARTLTKKIIMCLRPAATMLFVNMMMLGGKPRKARKHLYKFGCCSILLIKRMTRKLWCNIIKSWKKVLRTNCHWQRFTTCVVTTKRRQKFTRSYFYRQESSKP